MEFLLRIKIISAVLSILFGALTVYFVIKIRGLVSEKFRAAKMALRTSEVATGGASRSKWEEILRHLDSPHETEWKFAVIEADKLTDDVLKSAGYHGETMGDRLMNIEQGKLTSLEGLWEAHKIRNKLVHDVNYFLRYGEARRAVLLFEQALKELGGI